MCAPHSNYLSLLGASLAGDGATALPHFDLPSLIQTVGLIGVIFIVFAESGLFFGFFLPGDSLLFTAGFLASQGFFNIWVLSVLCGIAAILGDSVGYWFGQRVGPRLFNREDSIWFHKRHLERAHAFYAQHGGKAIVLARFMPVVRTFAPIVAGAARMSYPQFLAYNVLGGILWGVGVSWAGYFLGNLIPDVDKYLLPIIALIILVSVLPPAIHFWRDSGEDIVAAIKTRLSRRGRPLPSSDS
jgi:membrane-associated protein